MAYEVQTGKEDQSLGELFAELARETATLVRQEVALAKTELSQKGAEVGKNIGFLVAGGAVAYAGLLIILIGLVYLLHEVMGLPLWVSGLLVGAVVAAAGGFLVSKGLARLKNLDPVPRETLETLKGR